jgi:hypothetical protein
MQFPRFGLIKQRFPQHPEPATEAWLDAELKRTGLLSPVKKGHKVAITAGSRGIDGMPEVLAILVKEVLALGGEPFIYPAMGSHGGGEAKDQVAVLKHLGITPETVGAPILSELNYVEIGQVAGLTPVVVDKAAVDADHIIIVNRIKEHTEHTSKAESGLRKMTVVGLGRQRGAESFHHLAVNITYYKAINAIAGLIYDKLNVLGGIALLEDHFGRLRRLEAVPTDDIFDREPALFAESKKYKPKLPVDHADILLVDEIGKEISGTGVDTKVVGRIMNTYEEECDTPRITRIIIRDLTPQTAGNAVGIGLADFTTQRVIDQIDLQKLAVNCITAASPEKGRIPIAMPTDKAAFEAALRTIGIWTPDKVRVLWMSNSKQLAWVAASEAVIRDCVERSDLETADQRFDLPFDAQGDLPRLMTLIPE